MYYTLIIIISLYFIFLLQCIELLGLNCFTAEQYTKIVDLINDQLETCFLKLKKRLDKRLDEDYDEEVEYELEAEVCDHTHNTTRPHYIHTHLQCCYVTEIKSTFSWGIWILLSYTKRKECYN